MGENQTHRYCVPKGEAERQPFFRTITRLIRKSLLPKCSGQHRPRRNSLVDKQPTETRGCVCAARVTKDVVCVIANLSMISSEGCSDRGETPMCHDHLWIANRCCQCAEPMRSLDRFDVVTIRGVIDNQSVESSVLGRRLSLALCAGQGFGETIPHRGHIAARMPNRVAARVQQADLNIRIVERTAASDRDRSFDALP